MSAPSAQLGRTPTLELRPRDLPPFTTTRPDCAAYLSRIGVLLLGTANGLELAWWGAGRSRTPLPRAGTRQMVPTAVGGHVVASALIGVIRWTLQGESAWLSWQEASTGIVAAVATDASAELVAIVEEATRRDLGPTPPLRCRVRRVRVTLASDHWIERVLAEDAFPVVGLSHGGRLALAASCRTRCVELHDVETGRLLRAVHLGLPARGNPVCGALTPDGRHAALVTDSGTALLVGFERARIVAAVGHAGGRVCAIWVAPDASVVLTASETGVLQAWWPGASTTQQLRTPDGPLRACTFTDDGTTAVTVGCDDQVRGWSLAWSPEGTPPPGAEAASEWRCAGPPVVTVHDLPDPALEGAPPRRLWFTAPDGERSDVALGAGIVRVSPGRAGRVELSRSAQPRYLTEFLPRPDGVRVRGAASSTRLNGQPVSVADLRPGDVLEVADYRVELEEG